MNSKKFPGLGEGPSIMHGHVQHASLDGSNFAHHAAMRSDSCDKLIGLFLSVPKEHLSVGQ